MILNYIKLGKQNKGSKSVVCARVGRGKHNLYSGVASMETASAKEEGSRNGSSRPDPIGMRVIPEGSPSESAAGFPDGEAYRSGALPRKAV